MSEASDAELLRTFSADGDERAFAEMLRRHGATTWGAAHAVLGDAAAAEDVVQATFLTLARKAGVLASEGSLGGWLHRVAVCLARNARRAARRRAAREKELAMLATAPDATPAPAAAVVAALHEELANLAAPDRAPLVLHYLEGHSYAAAAAALGCKESAFGMRLARARERLRRRLVARGFALGADGLGGVLEEGATSVALPAALVAATCQAASLLAAGKTLSGTGLVSAKVAYLTKSALKTLFWAKVRTAAAAVALTLGVAVGGGLVAHQMLAHRVVTASAPALGGQVWAWGDNQAGQLGDGTTTPRPTPVPVPDLAGVIAIAAGSSHTLALQRDHTVWAWGGNHAGQLGDGTTTNRSAPVPVKLADGTPLADVTAIGAGASYSAALRRDGSVWTWGQNERGQLGDGTMGNGNQRLNPGPVKLADGAPLSGVTAIAAGQYHLVALTAERSVWAWGCNFRGQLSIGPVGLQNQPHPLPVKLADGAPLTGVMAIAAGGNHTLVLKGDGSAWAWGLNGEGQLGDGTRENRWNPVAVTMPDGAPLSGLTAIAAGWLYTVALARDGGIWAWGNNQFGQLGDGTTVSRSFPVPVRLPDGAPLSGVTAIATGEMHTVARQADGKVLVWGRNLSGQLGDGTTGLLNQRLNPLAVKLADGSPLTGVTAIAAGLGHTVVVVGGMGVEEVNSGQ